MQLCSSLLFVLALLQATPAVAQQPAPSSGRTPAAAQPLSDPSAHPTPGQATSTAYVIGQQDVLQITVFDEPELTNKYRVDSDGFITFPLINRIAARGLTLGEFQDRLKAQLASGYLKNPQVRVEIDQYKSQSVYVIGEVRQPGRITMTGMTMTLLEALALAGSPTNNASNDVIVVHPARPATGPAPSADADGERIHVNRKELELGRAGQDVLLRDGDIINVPAAQRFYVSGYVRNPGYYILDPGMTVQQAIAMAGGLAERGSDRRITVTRMLPNGKLGELGVKLEDKVQPNDTINVPPRFF